MPQVQREPDLYTVAVDRVRHVCSAGRVVCACDLAVILGLFTRCQR
jgi:hypothetical protein